MLKRPTNKIMGDLKKGYITGVDFLRIGLYEIGQALKIEGMYGILFPDFDSKYIEGMILLENLGFNQETINLYRIKYELLLKPIKEKIAEKTEEIKKRNLKNLEEINISNSNTFFKKSMSIREMRRINKKEV